MAKLIKAVFVRDPDRHATVLLQPGEEPEPRLAAQVTNPDCWEDGQAPTFSTGDTADEKDTDQAASAAKKTAARKSAATKPAQGRDAADEGTSGD